MNNDNQGFSSRERGLLSVASQHKGSVAFYENTVIPHLEASLVKAWAKHYCEEDIWEYIQEAKWNTYVKIDSAKIGILTTIADYTNISFGLLSVQSLPTLTPFCFTRELNSSNNCSRSFSSSPTLVRVNTSVAVSP